VASDLLDERLSWSLQKNLEITSRALDNGRQQVAVTGMRTFKKQVQWLVDNGQLLPHAGELLIAAADAAIACL
jgi:hypothetical protein